MKIVITSADPSIRTWGTGVKTSMALTMADDEGALYYQDKKCQWAKMPTYEGDFIFREDGNVKKCHAKFDMEFMQKWHRTPNAMALTELSKALAKYYSSDMYYAGDNHWESTNN